MMHQNSDEKTRLKFLAEKLELSSQASWCLLQYYLYPRLCNHEEKSFFLWKSAAITFTLTNNFHSVRAKDETLVKAELGHFLIAFYKTLHENLFVQLSQTELGK